jgi:hypothetical protein
MVTWAKIRCHPFCKREGYDVFPMKKELLILSNHLLFSAPTPTTARNFGLSDHLPSEMPKKIIFKCKWQNYRGGTMVNQQVSHIALASGGRTRRREWWRHAGQRNVPGDRSTPRTREVPRGPACAGGHARVWICAGGTLHPTPLPPDARRRLPYVAAAPRAHASASRCRCCAVRDVRVRCPGAVPLRRRGRRGEGAGGGAHVVG